ERDLDHGENLGGKTKKRGRGPRFGWMDALDVPASAGYRPFPLGKRPLRPCGVVRGVITRMPFSLLLRPAAGTRKLSILSAAGPNDTAPADRPDGAAFRQVQGARSQVAAGPP